MSELQTEKQMATVTWIKNTPAVEAAEGVEAKPAGQEVISSDTCPRSMPCIQEFIQTKAPEFNGADIVKVSIKINKPAEGDKPAQDMEFTIIEDTPANVLQGIQQRMEAIQGPGFQLRMVVAKLMDMTDMTACLMTCVRATGAVEGFSVLTESAPVYQEDALLLADASTNQVKAFKETMGKAFGVQFQDEKSRIIIPGR